MARRLTERFLDRSAVRRPPLAALRAGAGPVLIGRASAFAVNLLSDSRLQRGMGTLSSQITSLVARGSVPTASHRPPAHTLLSGRVPARKRFAGMYRGSAVAGPVGMGTASFRPNFPPALARTPLPVPALSPVRAEPPLLRPRRGLTAFEADTTDIFAPALLGRTRVEDTRRLADDVVPPQATASPDTLRADRGRTETREGDEPEANTDYRRLGATPLRDMLRRRGGQGESPNFGLRERLRGTLGFDPALARLHRSSVAADAARLLRAQAFTIGQDVFFAEGRFDTTSRAGLELITHELTHVGQQTRSGLNQTRFFTAAGGDAQEEEAQQTAARLMTPSLLSRPSGGPAMGSSLAAPEMSLAMPPASPGGGAAGGSAPIQRMADPSAGGGGASSYAPRPRPQPVADRVYELMKQELLRDNRRGLLTGKGRDQ